MDHRIAVSALHAAGSPERTDDVLGSVTRYGERARACTEIVPLDSLDGWSVDPDLGIITHRSGGFFSVVGIDVRVPSAAVPSWDQPIIDQSEVGILGLLLKEFDGVLHALVQLKAEPGNINGVQISPTVQATRSNYTGVHGGRRVPYLEHFIDPEEPASVVCDVPQSEQAAWFLRKHNRNIAVETTREITVRDGYHWLTINQLHTLCAMDDLVNADARSVLACLPLRTAQRDGHDGFTDAVMRSCDPSQGARHRFTRILSWITELRSRTDARVRRVGLHQLRDWHDDGARLAHLRGGFFDVIGVRVSARGREVTGWDQPMIAAKGTGLLAFLATRFRGVLHVLAQMRTEPGCHDTAELAPTVQATPENYYLLPAQARPAFLDRVLEATDDEIRFDTTLSDEGGRFHHTRSRHMVVEVAADEAGEPPGYRWLALHQITELLKHSSYVNMQARSLFACVRSLAARTARVTGPTNPYPSCRAGSAEPTDEVREAEH